ncbi:lanthionine synthetase C family protein [Streptomyces sp. CL12-4]|uniref:lanthionine synthetase C family protein n=1 Tax=Streptomyces sp. CL12-4 TaxID=2810306 RepID=UPI001EFA3877|nr:lanthionine synthetase C family protein [Streptomyces sp. CL12-4]MCG8971765.1 lanthionine synthetase C family protein [Streptomyces sp. CL12-4]
MRHDDLGAGLAGTALQTMVFARSSGRWDDAHAAARAVTAQPLAGHPAQASLYRGVPAVAYALHIADHPAYARACAGLEAETIAIVADRVDAGLRRMDSGRPPRMAEYDLISGLTGLGAFLLRSDRGAALERVLHYLVRLLTEPVTIAGHQVPGWWTLDSPSGAIEDGTFSTGHANLGLAHGMPGPLALLALASRAGYTVDGQDQALDEGIAVLTQWAQPQAGGSIGWPDLVPLDAFLAGPAPGAEPTRPSWCYGAPGIGRALQLAALARHDHQARQTAERAVLDSATDPRQLAQLHDATVCHGWAGLLLTCDRIAADAMTPDIAYQLPKLHAQLDTHLVRHEISQDAGLLEGNAGVRLTLHALRTPRPPALGWETCLLLN